MKRMDVRAVFLSAILCAAFAQAPAQKVSGTKQSKVEQEVLQVENERIQAVVGVDTQALDRILADTLVYTHSSARVESKAQFIKSLQTGELKYESIKHQDLKARVYGDVAVLIGQSAVQVRSAQTGGQARSLDIRFLNVYAKLEGRWQQVAWQSTRISQP